ncbi:MAG: glutaredoxin family protein, partial [Gammaproteobacteria bacterium]|nr:glutaredoxin family protein [Gammaproteobacteria bacterium]
AITLFGREECELCDRAEQLFYQVAGPGGPALNKVDIDSDAALLARYRFVIPVLRCNANGSELCWPFPPSRLREFLAQAR